MPDRWRIGEGLAVFFDLPPVLVLDSTEDFIRIGFYVVPVIQRWPQPSALLPTSRLLHALININQPGALSSPPRGVAFILDGERDGRRFALAPADARLDLRRFDNRYHYTADRFPSPETLRRYGIHRVEWVSEAGVAPDLQPYALDLAAAGLRPQALEPGDVASL